MRRAFLEVSMVVSSLKPGVVTLIKDSNCNHVVQAVLATTVQCSISWIWKCHG
jgi:hypothetical protein